MSDTIEDWHRKQPEVIRTVSIDFLRGGAFNIREGDYHAVMNFDEMLGWMAHAGFKTMDPSRRDAATLYPTDPPSPLPL